MSNDVVIHVKWDDAGGDRFATETKAKAKKAGEGAGDEFSGSFRGKLVPGADKAATDAAGRLRDSRGRFVKAGEELGDSAGEGIEKGVKQGAERGGKAADDEMSKVAKRANAKFNALAFAGLSLGLPAAAAAGAAGVTLALAAIPAAAVGVGAYLNRNNDQVQQSFQSLSTNVIADAKSMVGVMAGPLAQAGSDLQTSWNRIEPLARTAFAGASMQVSTLTGTVTDFAENAMPGLVAAVKASHPVLLGLRDFAGQAGTGLGQFFENASKGAEGAQRGFTILGGTVQLLESRLGQVFGNLANISSGPLLALHSVVDQVSGSLVKMTAQGSGVVGALSGFTGAASGAVTVATTLLNALSALPPQVTQFAGAFGAVSMVASKFGLDVGKGFEGLGGKIREAEGATGKLKTAFGGLAAGAFNPTTFAVAALGAGLMLLGERQQAAAADAAAHAERERSLAAALKESSGAIDGNVRATAAKSLAEYKVSDGTRNLLADTQKLAGPNGVQLLTDGYLGNADASKKLVEQLRQTATEHTHGISVLEGAVTQFDHFHKTLDGNTGALDDTGYAAKQLADIIEASGGDFQKAQETAAAMGIAVRGNVAPMNALQAATEGLKSAAAGSEERLNALVNVLNILEGRNASFEQAIKSGNDALRTMEDSLKNGANKADGFGKALLNADGSLNTFTKNGSDLQSLATGLETSFSQAGNSIQEMVRQGVPFDQAVGKVNDGLKTQRDRFVGVAEKMGLTKQQAEDLATKYGLIPPEISTRVTADIKQGVDAINSLPGIAANTHGAVPISADVDKATGKIQTTVQYADGSLGVITIDGNKDPATGKTMVAVQYADGQRGFITVDAFNQAAKDRTIEAKRNADGTVAYIYVGANTSAAAAAINALTAPRYMTIYTTTVDQSGNVHRSSSKFAATGGLITHSGVQRFAKGGQVLARFAGGGPALDVGPGGFLAGPGSGTSDSIPAMVSNGEFVVNARAAAQYLPWLQAINSGNAPSRRSTPIGTAGGGSGGATHVILELRSSGAVVDDLLLETLRKSIRIKGGNVQVVLGS